MSGIEADVTVNGARVILGDMREVLPEIDLRADLIFSDPPYRLTSGGGTSIMRGCLSADQYDNKGELFDLVPWDEMAPLIWSSCAPDADAIIMTSDREEAIARAAFEAVGFQFHRLLVWDKGRGTPNRWYMPNVEFALYLWRGNARPINDCGSKALVACPPMDVSAAYLPDDLPIEERIGHATEKPVPLVRRWVVNSTDPGGLVLDPFAGTGSTVVAAIEAGRRVVAIEKDPKWFDVIVKRAEEARPIGQAFGVKRAGRGGGDQGALALDFGPAENGAVSAAGAGVRS